jgi:hypothetical protein
VLLGNKFSKLHELFCNYKETFYVLVTESSRNVSSADREDSLGKEKLYLRKITIIDV